MSGLGGWSSEQMRAILHRGDNILVSSGAGTGKTACLVERVVRLALDPDRPVPLERMLVVTFTDAAAAELRERVREAVRASAASSPSDWAERQLRSVERSQISTLHSFCLRITRRCSASLGLSPGFAVMDELEAELLRREVLEDVLRERLLEPGDPMVQLAERYGGGFEHRSLKETILKLHQVARNHPWMHEWLRRAQARLDPTASSFWVGRLTSILGRHARKAAGYLRAGLDLASDGFPAYVEVLQGDLDLAEELAEELESFRGEGPPSWTLEPPPFGRLPRARPATEEEASIQERIKALRRKAKAALADLVKASSVWFRQDPAAIGETSGCMLAICDAVLELDARFARAKREAGTVDFNDLERLSLEMLLAPGSRPGRIAPSKTALRIRGEFDEIMVDEYQDINPLQDMVLWLVSRQADRRPPNLFAVGDLKQSIYGFRMAEPRVFLRKHASYGLNWDRSGSEPEKDFQEPDPDLLAPATRGFRLELRENRRSRKEIVDAVNFVFRQIMTESFTGFGYAGAEMNAGVGQHEGQAESPVQVHVIAGKDRQDGDAQAETWIEREARLAAHLILEMAGMKGGPPLDVMDAGGPRPIGWGDIAVLMRAPRGRAKVFAGILGASGIPARAEDEGAFFEAPEVFVALSLLSVVDDPLSDSALASVLASPVVGLEPADLALLRAHRRGPLFYALESLAESSESSPALRRKASEFVRSLKRWRELAKQAPLKDAVWTILQESGYADYAGGLPGGDGRKANLRRLCDAAAALQARGAASLWELLDLMERLKETGSSPPSGALPKESAAVQIMSIHRSKGLEFPVVIIAGLNGRFNMADLRGDVLVHRDLGMGPLIVDLDRGVKFPGAAHSVVADGLKRDILSEETRTLYVAMTRARERLVMICSCNDLRSKCESWSPLLGSSDWRLPDWLLLDAKSHFDWLGPCLFRHPDGTVLRNLWQSPGKDAETDFKEDPSRWAMQVWSEEEIPALGETRRHEEEGNGETAAPGHRELLEVMLKRMTWRPDPLLRNAPAKMSASAPLTAAPAVSRDLLWAGTIPERAPCEDPGHSRPSKAGTATHAVLKHIDLRARLDLEGVKREIDRMVRQKLISPADAALVRADRITGLFEAPIGRKMRAFPSLVKRELSFTLLASLEDLAAAFDPAALRDAGFHEAGREDRILVQGSMDCLIEDPEEHWIVDYKTDKVRKGTEVQKAAERYRPQLLVYRHAVCKLFGARRVRAFLFFLEPGVSWEIAP